MYAIRSYYEFGHRRLGEVEDLGDLGGLEAFDRGEQERLARFRREGLEVRLRALLPGERRGLVVITSYSIHYTKLYDVDRGALDVGDRAVLAEGGDAVSGAPHRVHQAVVITSYSIHYTKLYE